MLFQFDDSKSLHEKPRCFTKHPLKQRLFGVPGGNEVCFLPHCVRHCEPRFRHAARYGLREIAMIVFQMYHDLEIMYLLA